MWTSQWNRNITSPQHLGDEVPVWWMSGKFGSSTYNRANGTFSNVVITSNGFTYDTTMSPMSSAPTFEPTVEPTMEPTFESTESTEPNPGLTLFAVTETNGTNDADTLSQSTMSTVSISDTVHVDNMEPVTTESTQSVVYYDDSVSSIWNPHFSDMATVLLVVAVCTVICCVVIICVFVCVMRHQMKALDEEVKLSRAMRDARGSYSQYAPSHTLSQWTPDGDPKSSNPFPRISIDHRGMVKEFSPSPVNIESVPTTMTSLVTHEYPSNGIGSPYFRRNTMGTRQPMDVLPATSGSTTSPTSQHTEDCTDSTVSSSPHASDTGSVLDGLDTMYGAYSPSQDQGKFIEGTGVKEEVSV